MKSKFLIRLAAVCIAAFIAMVPVDASAATLLKKGSRGSEVVTAQTTLKELGYYTYSKATGYYGDITRASVKKFQKANGLAADGIIGDKTWALLKKKASAKKAADQKSDTAKSVKAAAADAVSGSAIRLQSLTGTAAVISANLIPEYSGALDWFKEVRYIWSRGEDAVITDVETGLSFQVKRTYGTNHADVEPLTKADTAVVKKIWGGFNWERRAVIVQVGKYTIAASMTGMPHAGVDSKPANKYVSGRSAGYGKGTNLDAVKNNGCSGVMDIHFKNSRTHTTNTLQKSQQDMVKKAAKLIHELL